ncbi:glycosyltransferase family 2 protein [Candidatus Haliotispira prima]|uniref:Glycosyltransferase family 2 protein n=1 Tax=Candidatus Haliotispira prima TaxID=3034016 RepID=A0ABY8MI82_9SPIO|nr:glycosyltransferase family 2 protein [Candidatus Haliotispira prima]
MSTMASTTAETEAQQPAISVIVPIYDVEECLERTLQSVLEQSFGDWELILVDDASGDGSLEIARSFERKDARVRVFSLPQNSPGGAATPSNIGLKHAKGKYVAFLDSDDLYFPDFLETLYRHSEIFENVDVAMVRYQIYYLDKDREQVCYPDAWSWLNLIHPKLGSRHQRQKVRYVRLDRTRSCIRHRDRGRAWSRVQAFHLFSGLSVVPWRKLYRRDFLLQHKIRFPEGEYFFEDIPLHWIVCSRANNILLCDTVAYRHNIGRQGQTVSEARDKQVYAKLFQSERVLDYLLSALEKNQLGEGARFYLLLWLRSLLQTFCYGLRLSGLKQWQVFYLETEAMLRRRIRANPKLAAFIRPLYGLRISDTFHLRLDILEIIAWQLFTSGILKKRDGTDGCGKFVTAYLAVLCFPLTGYGHAMRNRLRYLASKFRSG